MLLGTNSFHQTNQGGAKNGLDDMQLPADKGNDVDIAAICLLFQVERYQCRCHRLHVPNLTALFRPLELFCEEMSLGVCNDLEILFSRENFYGLTHRLVITLPHHNMTTQTPQLSHAIQLFMRPRLDIHSPLGSM